MSDLFPRPNPATDEPTVEFTLAELEEMVAEGITLEDAIRAIDPGEPAPDWCVRRLGTE